MSNCMAQAHRYVGQGAERKLYTGQCVLELGHDLDHLPADLAAEQIYNRAFNEGVDAAIAYVDEQDDSPSTLGLLTGLKELKR